MRNGVLALLLLLVVSPALAAPGQLADVLQHLRLHGYASPTAAAARLEAAYRSGGAAASLDDRRRYYEALIGLALPGRNLPLLQQALDGLQALADHDHCSPCRASWLIGKAEQDTLEHRLQDARTHLAEAAPLVPADDPSLQVVLAGARIDLDRSQGTLNLALSEALAAAPLARRAGDRAAHVNLLVTLSVIDAELGYFERAAQTAAEAARAAEAIGFTAALGLARINQGYIYSLQDKRPAQLHALQQALAIAEATPGLGYVEIYARINLSDYYLGQGDYPRTLAYARAGQRLAHASGDQYAEGIALTNIGMATARTGRVAEGIGMLQRALALGRASGNLRAEVAINAELVKMLKAAGRYEEALAALEAIQAVDDKITRQERDGAVLALQAKYDDERKNREIQELSAQSRLHAAEASAQQWRKRMWTMLAGVAILAALLLVYRLRRARRANRRLAVDVANLTEQSALDALTGVFNRRHFDTLMRPYGRDPGARVGLVMLDIDRFKRINDSFGHDIGDRVLTEVARRLQSLGRSRDRVVRWGGEEFVLVLPDATPASLPALARRLLEVIAERPIAAGPQAVRMTVSAGCVSHPLAPGVSWEQALRLADAAMYRAKRHGRNRATCVGGIADARAPRLADIDLAAAMRTGTITVTEIAGPDAPSAATDG